MLINLESQRYLALREGGQLLTFVPFHYMLMIFNDIHLRRKVKPLERYIPRGERDDPDWLDMFDLIRGMLAIDPSRRMTLPAAMKHPFLEKVALRKPSRNENY